ncbi:MAG: hypothetical protein H7831_08455 [Magnetococcus sp. WYHC-3]
MTIAPIYKYVNGVKTKQGFDTTSGIGLIEFAGKTERFSFESCSVNATTKVSTLGTCVRGLSVNSTTASYAAGTGMAWPKGARVTVVQDASYIQSGMFTTRTNTMTGSGAVRSSSTTTPVVRLNSVTTTERNAITAGNGDMVYDSTLGQVYKYEAGAWAAVATGTFSNAANTVAGKVDIATAAEIGAGTATDATSGALNVIPVSQTAKTSAGAGDENRLPVLDSAGNLAIGFLPTVTVAKGGTGRTTHTEYAVLCGGTSTTAAQQSIASVGTAGQVLTSNGASALPTFQSHTPNAHSVAITSSAAIGASSTAEASLNVNSTISANSMAASDVFLIKASGGYRLDSGDLTLRLKLGAIVMGLAYVNIATNALEGWSLDAWITVRSIGASGSLIAGGQIITSIESTGGEFAALCGDAGGAVTTAQTIDTTAEQTLQLSGQFSASDADHSMTLDSLIVLKLT